MPQIDCIVLEASVPCLVDQANAAIAKMYRKHHLIAVLRHRQADIVCRSGRFFCVNFTIITLHLILMDQQKPHEESDIVN